MKAETGLRRHDLDWLRVFAILGVFTYHSLHFFDPGGWSVKNPTVYPWVGELMALFGLYVMPLIFVISGEAVYYASRKGSAAGFARDKVLRLLVPLVIGIFTFAPTQVYVERVSHGEFHGSFWLFLPHYFEGVYISPGDGGNFSFHGMHLWYLLALFVLTFLFMPLFWLLRSEGGGGGRCAGWATCWRCPEASSCWSCRPLCCRTSPTAGRWVGSTCLCGGRCTISGSSSAGT